jgi:hypothetical protein
MKPVIDERNENKNENALYNEYLAQTEQGDKHNYSITFTDYSDSSCCC